MFDEKRWTTEKSIPKLAVDHDQVWELLLKRLPKSLCNRIQFKIISSTLHKDYCRIIFIIPSNPDLVIVSGKKLSKLGKCTNKRKNHKTGGVGPVYIPIKSKTGLIDYPFKERVFGANILGWKFEDRVDLIREYVENEIYENRQIIVVDIINYCNNNKLAENDLEGIIRNLIDNLKLYLHHKD